MPGQDDRKVIRELQQGSVEALRAIYEAYRHDLLRLAVVLLTDVSAAEDVVHDVFSGFIKAAAGFRLRGSLKGYLATCVANRARNLNRDGFRKREATLEAAGEVAVDAERPDGWIIKNERFELLSAALGQLPYEQREVVVLHLQGDLKFREIAREQNVSIKTVQSRYRYGLEKLRQILNSELEL